MKNISRPVAASLLAGTLAFGACGEAEPQLTQVKGTTETVQKLGKKVTTTTLDILEVTTTTEASMEVPETLKIKFGDQVPKVPLYAPEPGRDQRYSLRPAKLGVPQHLAMVDMPILKDVNIDTEDEEIKKNNHFAFLYSYDGKGFVMTGLQFNIEFDIVYRDADDWSRAGEYGLAVLQEDCHVLMGTSPEDPNLLKITLDGVEPYERS